MVVLPRCRGRSQHAAPQCASSWQGAEAVSYTHLDVYKRQPPEGAPTVFRAFIAGHAVRLDEPQLAGLRKRVLRGFAVPAGTRLS